MMKASHVAKRFDHSSKMRAHGQKLLTRVVFDQSGKPLNLFSTFQKLTNKEHDHPVLLVANGFLQVACNHVKAKKENGEIEIIAAVLIPFLFNVISFHLFLFLLCVLSSAVCDI